ncbi:unnamed protein product [Sphagnum jensenii]|uniref:Uncharacterized protein n=1 Tax=Sphagnum jensenii TaxID=128206 RepID=A0ABP1AMQ4_9BRYO
MDADVDRNEVNVDENEMDVHDIVQVEGKRRRLATIAGNGKWWVTCTTAGDGVWWVMGTTVGDGGWWVTHTTAIGIVGGRCIPWSRSCRNPTGFLLGLLGA